MFKVFQESLLLLLYLNLLSFLQFRELATSHIILFHSACEGEGENIDRRKAASRKSENKAPYLKYKFTHSRELKEVPKVLGRESKSRG